jgi:hypothetical protein
VRNFGEQVCGTESQEAVRAYGELMQGCLHALLCPKKDLSGAAAYTQDCGCLARAAAQMLQYCRDKASLAPSVFTILFLETLNGCCKQATDKLMLGELIHQLVALRMLDTAGVLSLSQPTADKNQSFHLKWNHCEGDKGEQLPFFADDLCLALDGVKRPKALVTVIRDNKSGLKFVVPHGHLCTVLALFDLMEKAGRFSCKGNHGLIQFLSRHIEAAKGEAKYNIKLFRLHKSRALKDKDHKLIIKNAIKDLYFKYCRGEEAENVFINYFSQDPL